MWYNYFVEGIAIITLIRLSFILGGSMELSEKKSKVTNWLVGVILIWIAWTILSQVFNIYLGEFGDRNSNSSKEETIDNIPKEDENHVPIIINPNP